MIDRDHLVEDYTHDHHLKDQDHLVEDQDHLVEDQGLLEEDTDLLVDTQDLLDVDLLEEGHLPVGEGIAGDQDHLAGPRRMKEGVGIIQDLIIITGEEVIHPCLDDFTFN